MFELTNVIRAELHPLVVVVPDPGVDQLGELLAGQALVRVGEGCGALPRRPELVIRRGQGPIS
ncbi:MAG TPA: hypothetical protein VN327_11420 [Pseudonocardiaceae bacterium]|nr:hypothetical protein [Pseudonocardiaceae bacterium]